MGGQSDRYNLSILQYQFIELLSLVARISGCYVEMMIPCEDHLFFGGRCWVWEEDW
jgi:hypothetical protein